MNQQIGTQVKLPLNTAVQIAMQGIAIRLGRAVVTISGVVLGIAFLMSVLTGEVIIKRAIAREQQLQQTVKLMTTSVRAEVGALTGKTLGIIVLGELSKAEQTFLTALQRGKPGALQVAGLTRNGMISKELTTVGADASLLLILGNGSTCAASLSDLTQGMKQTVVLDSNGARQYPAGAVSAVRRELFFGEQTQEEEKKLAEKAQQETFRTTWIVVISLLVTVIGIANALLMSVTERFKEIGTMKCLGAMSAFIRQLFLIESAFIGVTGSLLGIILGVLFPMLAYGFTFGFGVVLHSLDGGLLALSSLGCLVAGTLLSILAAIYPANFAASMVPATALRSNI
jgi:hypothetical protein